MAEPGEIPSSNTEAQTDTTTVLNQAIESHPATSVGPTEVQRLAVEKTRSWGETMDAMDKSVENDGQYFARFVSQQPDQELNTRAHVLRASMPGDEPGSEVFLGITPDGPIKIVPPDYDTTGRLSAIITRVANGDLEASRDASRVELRRNSLRPELVTINFDAFGEYRSLRATFLDPSNPTDQEALTTAIKKSKEITPSKTTAEEAQKSIEWAKSLTDSISS